MYEMYGLTDTEYCMYHFFDTNQTSLSGDVLNGDVYLKTTHFANKYKRLLSQSYNTIDITKDISLYDYIVLCHRYYLRNLKANNII